MIKFTIGLWIFVILAGVSALARFAYVPGDAANAPKSWPILTRLPAPANRPEILVFLHPKCGCSQATLRNLETMLPEIGEKAVVKLVLNDLGDPKLLEESRAFSTAKTLKNITLVVDHNGFETNAFEVKTSGQVMLYDESGRLVFAGGLTPFRGHEGVSEGELSIVKWLNQRDMTWKTTSVFGCAMKEKI